MDLNKDEIADLNVTLANLQEQLANTKAQIETREAYQEDLANYLDETEETAANYMEEGRQLHNGKPIPSCAAVSPNIVAEQVAQAKRNKALPADQQDHRNLFDLAAERSARARVPKPVNTGKGNAAAATSTPAKPAPKQPDGLDSILDELNAAEFTMDENEEHDRNRRTGAKYEPTDYEREVDEYNRQHRENFEKFSAGNFDYTAPPKPKKSKPKKQPKQPKPSSQEGFSGYGYGSLHGGGWTGVTGGYPGYTNPYDPPRPQPSVFPSNTASYGSASYGSSPYHSSHQPQSQPSFQPPPRRPQPRSDWISMHHDPADGHLLRPTAEQINARVARAEQKERDQLQGELDQLGDRIEELE